MEIVITLIVVILLAALAIGAWNGYQRSKLRASFGPEYEQLAQQHGSKRAADRELLRRRQLHSRLTLRPITSEDHDLFAESWKHLQGTFIDDPALALAGAEKLVGEVLDARGYPGVDADERLALLSVEYADCLPDYRSAQRISNQVQDSSTPTSTEDMRQALLSYRKLFDELLNSAVMASV